MPAISTSLTFKKFLFFRIKETVFASRWFWNHLHNSRYRSQTDLNSVTRKSKWLLKTISRVNKSAPGHDHTFPSHLPERSYFFITIMILLPYKIFCYLTSEAFKNQLTLKTPEATSSASIKERKHFRIRNQERKLSPANILNEPAQTSRFRPQRPVRRSFPCLFYAPH